MLLNILFTLNWPTQNVKGTLHVCSNILPVGGNVKYLPRLDFMICWHSYMTTQAKFANSTIPSCWCGGCSSSRCWASVFCFPFYLIPKEMSTHLCNSTHSWMKEHTTYIFNIRNSIQSQPCRHSPWHLVFPSIYISKCRNGPQVDAAKESNIVFEPMSPRSIRYFYPKSRRKPGVQSGRVSWHNATHRFTGLLP